MEPIRKKPDYLDAWSFVIMEEDFTTADIIELMKKTKKTDPLFKPLKKIKTALEVSSILSRALAYRISHLQPLQEYWPSTSASATSWTNSS